VNIEDVLKIGKTMKHKKRLVVYNTALKDGVVVFYRAKVDDLSAVENCIKALFSKKVYRSYHEYYTVSIKEAIRGVKRCIKFSGSRLIAEDNYYKSMNIARSSRTSSDENLNISIGVSNYNNVVIDKDSGRVYEIESESSSQYSHDNSDSVQYSDSSSSDSLSSDEYESSSESDKSISSNESNNQTGGRIQNRYADFKFIKSMFGMIFMDFNWSCLHK